ncbi:hypothetical protein [Aquirufa sp. 5-AUSEE-100C1]
MNEVINLKSYKDLLELKPNSLLTKKNLWDLIQYSKVKGSEYYIDETYIIGNTPQQGINWVGKMPEFKLVIIKTKAGKYIHDGYEKKDYYNYSFKAQKGIINENETANKCLILQKINKHPILLLIEDGSNWRVEGFFTVSDIFDEYVRLLKIF